LSISVTELAGLEKPWQTDTLSTSASLPQAVRNIRFASTDLKALVNRFSQPSYREPFAATRGLLDHEKDDMFAELNRTDNVLLALLNVMEHRSLLVRKVTLVV
jgi:hypothetical protein